jgi:hypothetical protein
MALDPVTELAGLIAALETDGASYALCGGLALAVHGYVRATTDIDLLVPGTELERVIAVAKGVGFDVPGPRLTFGLKVGKPRQVQRLSKLDATGELLTLDLLIVNVELEPVWLGRVRASWGDQPLSVVSRDGLATMKRLAGRARDLDDIARLEGRDDEEDE